jgi:hypothetical protein
MAQKQPIADIRFLTDFHAYCLTRGDEAYDFVDPGECACCQFLKDTGRAASPRVIPENWRDGMLSDERYPLPEGLNSALNARFRADWTFSALAKRLEALLADAPAVVLAA